MGLGQSRFITAMGRACLGLNDEEGGGKKTIGDRLVERDIGLK